MNRSTLAGCLLATSLLLRPGWAEAPKEPAKEKGEPTEFSISVEAVSGPAQPGEAPPAGPRRDVRITLINHLVDGVVMTVDEREQEVGAESRATWEQTVPWPVSIRLRAHTPFPPSYTTAIDPDGRLHITFTIYKWV